MTYPYTWENKTAPADCHPPTVLCYKHPETPTRVNCICVSVLKWAFWLLGLPSMLIEIAIDIFIIMLPLSSHEESRTHKEKK